MCSGPISSGDWVGSVEWVGSVGVVGKGQFLCVYGKMWYDWGEYQRAIGQDRHVRSLFNANQLVAISAVAQVQEIFFVVMVDSNAPILLFWLVLLPRVRHNNNSLMVATVEKTRNNN